MSHDSYYKDLRGSMAQFSPLTPEQVVSIEVSVWYQLMEQLIKRENEQWLLDALIQWETAHYRHKESPTELRHKALALHSMRLFDSPGWVDYLPFNKRYRPEVYEQAHIVIVMNECCGVPGEVTQEQIERAYSDTVRCPHCGRWSKFMICSADSSEG